MSPRDGQPARVVDVAAAVDERAAVDPHHHRARRPSDGGGVHTFRVRQSSPLALPKSGSPPGSCMQRGPSSGGVAHTRPGAARAQAAASAAARQAVRRKGFRRTAGDRRRRRRAPCPSRSAPAPGPTACAAALGGRHAAAAAAAGQQHAPASASTRRSGGEAIAGARRQSLRSRSDAEPSHRVPASHRLRT